MASPFDIFRKNQKIWLAGITLMAIFAFVFLGSMDPTMFGGSGRQDPVVVTWKYGEIRESEIQDRQIWNNVLNEFFQRAVATSPEFQQLLATSPQFYQFIAQMNRIPMFPTDEETIVRSMLLARQAEKLGMEIGDDYIAARIRTATKDTLTPAQLNDVLRSLQVYDRGVTRAQLYDAMRPMLLAEAYYSMVLSGTDPVTPADRWDTFNELNRAVTAQVLPVPAANFVNEVKDPTERELKAFYQQYNDQVRQPETVMGRQLEPSEPAFKEPYRAKFQFFKADQTRFVERLIASDEITEEDIAQYYEANKHLFRVRQLPDASDGPAGEGTTTPAGEGTGVPAGEGTSSVGAPDGEGTRATAPAGEGTDEATSSDDPPASPDTKSQDQADDSAAVGKQDLIVRGQDEDANAPAGENTVEAPTQVPAGESTRPAGESTRPAGETTTDASRPAAPEVEYEPLEKVREQIRKDIAQQRAPQRIQEAFEGIRNQILDYKRDRVLFDVRGAEDPDLQAPTEPNYEQLAEKHELEFVDETPLLSEFEAATTRQIPYGNNDVFSIQAFDPNWPNLDPLVTRDIESNLYLIWKIDQKESEVPAFEDIREEVVKAWKLQKARDLALAKTREYAKQADQEKKSLKDIFGNEVLEVGPFTALTYGSTGRQQQQQSPRLTELPQLPQVGPEFMDVATSLPIGEAGVAMNHPKTVAYVIEPTGETQSREVLRIMFTTTDFQNYRAALEQERQIATQKWIKQLEEEANLHWERAPESTRG